MRRARGAVSGWRAGLGLAALLMAVGCGSTEPAQGAQPGAVLLPSSAGEPVQVWALTEEGEAGAGDAEGDAVLFTFAAGGPEQCRSFEQWRAFAVELCGRNAATLREAELIPGYTCDDDGSRYVRFTCQGALTPHLPESTSPYAYTGILGGPDQCRAEAEWAPLAAALCGPHEEAVQVRPEDACGEGQTRYARVTCDLPLQALPPPPACQLTSLAYPCLMPEDWPKLAAHHCALTGQTVGEVAVAPGRTCGVGGFDFAWVTCCGPKQTPPPSEECFVQVQGGPPSACKYPEELMAQARQSCAAAGATLESSVPMEPCGEDTFGYVWMNCCR